MARSTLFTRLDLHEGLDFVAPGQANMSIAAPVFLGTMGVGSASASEFVYLFSTTPNVVVTPGVPAYDPNTSNTFVSTKVNASTVVDGQLFVATNYTGTLSYETFRLAGLTALGQKFLLTNASAVSVRRDLRDACPGHHSPPPSPFPRCRLPTRRSLALASIVPVTLALPT